MSTSRRPMLSPGFADRYLSAAQERTFICPWRTRLRPCPLRELPRRAARRLFLQEPRRLSFLFGASDGRHGRPPA
jgi:hypothetical protein